MSLTLIMINQPIIISIPRCESLHVNCWKDYIIINKKPSQSHTIAVNEYIYQTSKRTYNQPLKNPDKSKKRVHFLH